MIVKVIDFNNCKIVIRDVCDIFIKHYDTESELNIVYQNGKVWAFDIRRIKSIRFVD